MLHGVILTIRGFVHLEHRLLKPHSSGGRKAAVHEAVRQSTSLLYRSSSRLSTP